jgi:hypothetical protein
VERTGPGAKEIRGGSIPSQAQASHGVRRKLPADARGGIFGFRAARARRPRTEWPALTSI